jgi:hypothetical protein
MPPFPFLPPSMSQQRRRLLPRHGAATVPPLNSPPPFTPVTAAMKVPITKVDHHSQLPRPPPDHIKGYLHSGGAPHHFTSPPSLLNRARVMAAWSRSFITGAPPPRRRPSSGERSPGRATSRPSCRHPRGKPPWPEAAAKPSSDEPQPLATV